MRALTAYTDDLFAPAMHQLVDDAQGGIRYWPDVIDPATAQRWFDLLHARALEFHIGEEPVRIRRMLERPLGSRGNSAIFPLRDSHLIARYLTVPFVDRHAGAHAGQCGLEGVG